MAYATHPERFVRGQPTAPPAPTAVWSNPPASARDLTPRDSTANALTGALTAADPGGSRVSAAIV